MGKKKEIEIVVDPGNARVHDERNQQVIQESLRELGAGRSIVIDKAGQVIAGNETYRQAKALGLPVKVVESDGQTLIVVQRKDLAPEDERRRALAIADNRSSDLSEFDMGILANTLKAAGPELRDAMGFTEKELAQVFRQAQPKDLKDPPAPPAPEEPRTKPGQLFSLGAHRLLCGDATKKKDVKRLMAGAEPFIMVTDPPYGVNVDPTWRDAAEVNWLAPGRKGHMTGDTEFNWQTAYELANTVVAYVWHSSLCAGQIKEHLEAAGYEIRQQIIWNKTVHSLSSSAYHWKHEPCWYGVRAKSKAFWSGGTDQMTVWELASPIMAFAGGQDDAKTSHPTQKPLECMGRPIRNHGKPGDIVYDPFLGSGTTLIAADQLERVCYGLEIDPGYCDVIIRRYAEFKEIDLEGIYATANVG